MVHLVQLFGHPIWTGMVIDSFTLRDTWTLEYKDRKNRPIGQ